MLSAKLSQKMKDYQLLVDQRRPATPVHSGTSRVAQLDAEMLDQELNNLIRAQLRCIAEPLPALQRLMLAHQAEVNMLLRLVLWVFSHRLNKASPGEALQNLRWRNERVYAAAHQKMLLKMPNDMPTRQQRLWQVLGLVVLPYVVEKVRRIGMQRRQQNEFSWLDKFCDIMESLAQVYAGLSLLNFLVFLYNGRYYRLLDRILGIRLVYARAEAQRGATFEFINQQLFYDGFSDLLMCLLPLLELDSVQLFWRKLNRWKTQALEVLRKRIPKLTFRGQTVDFFGSKNGEATRTNEELSEGECAKCNEAVCMAYKTSCKHLYCYYCLQCLVAESQNPSCLICGESITSAIRV